MANNNVIEKTNNLDKTIPVDPIGYLYTNETQAHQFIISCTRKGEKVRLTGSVTARFVTSQNTYFVVHGSIVDGNAVITLHQDCYSIPGHFDLAIFVTSGTTTTVVYAAVGTVKRTDSEEGVITGEPLPTLDELLAVVRDAQRIVSDFDDIILVQDTQPTSETNRIWVQPQVDEYQVPTYEEFEELKSAVDYTSGIEIIKLIRGAYINTADEPVNLAPNPSSSFNNGGYAVVNCSEGDIFVINGTGGASARSLLWCFIDSNNEIITKSDSNVTKENLILTAPANVSKLIINSITNKTSVKGLTPNIRIDKIASHLNVSSIGHGLNNVYVEQGAISGADGSEITIDTRIRTGYIKFDSYPVAISCADGYEFNFYSYEEDFSYRGTYEYVTSYQLTRPEFWYRIVIRKSNNTKITADEFANAIDSGFIGANCIIPSVKLYKDIKNESSKTEQLALSVQNISSGVEQLALNLQNVSSETEQTALDLKNVSSGSTIFVEQGAISASGEEVNLSNRIRTGYIRFNEYPVTLTTASGYELKPYLYNEDFSYVSTGYWQATYTISGDNKFRRFVIRKTDDSDIAPADYATVFSSGMNNAYCIIPSRQLQKEIDEIKTLDEEYSLKLNQFNLNRNMVGNSDMVWEYQNWVFPQIISHTGIRDRLYFTFTSDMGYSGIAQYDYNTKELTKNILKQNVSGARDDHDLIALIMLPSKKILCAYSGGHNTDNNIYIRIANARESIETFENVITLKCSDRTSYAQLFYYDSKVYLFYRISNISWGYRIGTNGGTTWSDETVLMTNNQQMYCQFTETTTDGVLRMCCYTNPGESDTAIRMGFLHLDDMTLYDTDNQTAIGTSNIQRTSVSIVIPAPVDGKVNRLFNSAKTAINKTMILYSVFSVHGEGSGDDGKYYVYDNGTIIEVADCGLALWTPKAQLGIAWVGTSQIAVARGYDGKDWIEIYDYDNGTVTFNRTVASADRTSHETENYRTARPMIDNNNKALIYIQGYFNIDSFEDFIMDGHIYDLNSNELLI